MLPTVIIPSRTKRRIFASFSLENICNRRLASVSTKLCVMVSVLTFVIGLSIGVLLPTTYSTPVPVTVEYNRIEQIEGQLTTNFPRGEAESWSRVDNTAKFVAVRFTTKSSRIFALQHETSSDYVPNKNSAKNSNRTPIEKISPHYDKANATFRISDDQPQLSHQLDPAEASLDNEGSSYLHGTLDKISSVGPSPLFSLTSGLNSITGSKSVGSHPEVVSLTDIVQNGIFWNIRLESAVPPGFSDQEVEQWKLLTGQSEVLKLESGCGRMQNRKLTFENGSQACCRYRHNNDQVQGEIFSFYLSRLLGINNVPPSRLSVVKSTEKQWSRVLNHITIAQWAEEKPLVVTKFIEDVKPAYIPPVFRTSKRHLHPTEDDLLGRPLNELTELVQWTDLIIFDYLTANLDRVVNNMFNEQWNPDMMTSPAHNLIKVPAGSKSGLLLFIDNESGLLHGYRLIDKYDRYHLSLLKSICIFRQSTAHTISKLSRKNNAGKLLKKLFSHSEPEISEKWLEFLPAKNIKILNKRIDTVNEHIEYCRQLYDFNAPETS